MLKVSLVSMLQNTTFSKKGPKKALQMLEISYFDTSSCTWEIEENVLLNYPRTGLKLTSLFSTLTLLLSSPSSFLMNLFIHSAPATVLEQAESIIACLFSSFTNLPNCYSFLITITRYNSFIILTSLLLKKEEKMYSLLLPLDAAQSLFEILVFHF